MQEYLNIFGHLLPLLHESAELVERTVAAGGAAGMADVAPVGDEQVMGVRQVVAVDDGEQLLFAGRGSFCCVQAETRGGAEDVGIDGEHLLLEEFAEYDVGGLAADPRQGFQGLAIVRDLPVVLVL